MNFYIKNINKKLTVVHHDQNGDRIFYDEVQYVRFVAKNNIRG